MDNVDSVSMGHSHLDIVFLRCIIIVVVLEIETKSSRLLSATISANVVSASRFMVLVLGVGAEVFVAAYYTSLSSYGT